MDYNKQIMAQINLPKKQISQEAVLLVTTLSAFLTPFISSSINIALPSMGEEFGIDAVHLSWIATAFILAAVVCLVPFGRLADIYGRKRILTIGIIIYTLASISSALSTNEAWLIFSRIIQGIGGAGIFGTSAPILISAFPPSMRGRVLGINVAAVYIGLSAGPFLGGFLTQHFGWRSIFWSNVPLGLLIIGFIFWKMRGWDMAESRGEKFDYMGSLVYGLGVVAAMAGTTILPDSSAIWYILAGLIAFSMFIWRELNYTSPIFDVRLFTKNRPFILSNLAALINYSATFGVGFLMSLYLQYIRGFSPQSAGLVLVAMPIIQAGLSPFAGRLSDRIQPRFVATAGMGLTTIGLALLSTLSMDTPLVFIIISLVLLGMGFALFSSPNTNAVMSSVERKHYGVASGTLSTMRLSGQMISLAVVMFLFSLILGPVNISPENYEGLLTSMRTAMILFTTLCFIGIFASLSRGNTRKP